MFNILSFLLTNPITKKFVNKFLIGKSPKFVLLLAGGYLFYDGAKNGNLTQDNIVFIMGLFDGASKNDFQYVVIVLIFIVAIIYIFRKIKMIVDAIVEEHIKRIKKED